MPGGGQCKEQNSRGDPCGMAPGKDSDYCYIHDPKKAKDRAKSRKKAGKNRRRPKVATQDVGEVDLRSVEGVQAVLEATMQDTLALENSVARSRAVAYVAGQALKAIEVGEIEQRIDAIEQQLAGASL